MSDVLSLIASGGLGLLGLGRGIGQTLGAQKQREIEAAKARYSPFTGISPSKVEQPDLLGNVIQGAATGLAFGQELQKAGFGKGGEQTNQGDMFSALQKQRQGQQGSMFGIPSFQNMYSANPMAWQSLINSRGGY